MNNEQMCKKLPTEKQNVQIIALDLDDTLLKDDLTISDYTVSVLQKAAEKGIYVMLCSGRSDNAMLPFVHQLDIAGTEYGRYMVTQNGTNIVDLHKRMSIYSRILTNEVVQKVYERVVENDFSIHLYDSSTIYTFKKTERGQVDANLSGLNYVVKDDFETFMLSGFPKMVVPGDPEKLVAFQDLLRKEIGDKCVVFTSKPYFLEVLPKDSGKGEALVWLAKELNIPVENVMAFGDSMNDESMINLTGKRVSMINGRDEIKNAAKFITEFTNDEDGVAKFIEKWVL